METAPNFIYNSCPRRDRKMMRRSTTASLHEGLELGVAQVMVLASEVINRSEGISEVDKRSADKDANIEEVKTLTSSLKTEKEKSSEPESVNSELKHENELLQDDLKAVRDSNDELTE